ncbi:hypothetical protein F4861DRAFT_544624 [Xylaria intraflava]|nr:hypothetical protein F4861DRAFT_544624 [Xylaria intraflava]
MNPSDLKELENAYVTEMKRRGYDPKAWEQSIGNQSLPEEQKNVPEASSKSQCAIGDATEIIVRDETASSTCLIIGLEGINVYSTGTDGQERLLYDTGSTVDITNEKKDLIPGTIQDLRQGRPYLIMTGGGPVRAIAAGSTIYALTGPKGERKELRISFVLLVPSFPLRIVSGHRHYLRGGYIDHDSLVSPRGEVISTFNVSKRTFLLWLYGSPEPQLVSKDSHDVHTTREITELTSTLDSAMVNGRVFATTEVQRKLTLWHRRLCHPSTERLIWTIKWTTGIDLEPNEVEYLPCYSCDRAKAQKTISRDPQERATYPGEITWGDLGELKPISNSLIVQKTKLEKQSSIICDISVCA